MLGPKKFLVQKNLLQKKKLSKKNLRLKKILGLKKFGSKKDLSPKKNSDGKICVPKNFWSKKIRLQKTYLLHILAISPQWKLGSLRKELYQVLLGIYLCQRWTVKFKGIT